MNMHRLQNIFSPRAAKYWYSASSRMHFFFHELKQPKWFPILSENELRRLFAMSPIFNSTPFRCKYKFLSLFDFSFFNFFLCIRHKKKINRSTFTWILFSTNVIQYEYRVRNVYARYQFYGITGHAVMQNVHHTNMQIKDGTSLCA